MHNDTPKITQAYTRLMALFSDLKIAAPQLKPKNPWRWLMAKIIEAFNLLTPNARTKQGLSLGVSTG